MSNFFLNYKIDKNNCSNSSETTLIDCITNNLKKELFNLIDKKYNVDYITGADETVRDLLEKLQKTYPWAL